jgi:hypothetical protein
MLFWALLAPGQIIMRKIDDGGRSQQNLLIGRLAQDIDLRFMSQMSECSPDEANQQQWDEACRRRGCHSRLSASAASWECCATTPGQQNPLRSSCRQIDSQNGQPSAPSQLHLI